MSYNMNTPGDPRNRLDQSMVNTSALGDDSSIMNESNQFIKKMPPAQRVRVNPRPNATQQNQSTSRTQERRPSVQHQASRIRIKFGAGEVQDPIYRFKDNTVRTTKYTPATWAPKSLFLQFKKAANVYFLVITILTCLPFSPKKPASQIMTFVLVLFSTMIKEGYEDYQRFKQDRDANAMPATAFNPQTRRFEQIQSKDIQVGDLVKVVKDEPFPADVLLISSSSETGIAFVDTMNLDGETNLKEKICPKQTKDITEQEFIKCRGTIDCDAPNEYLDSWEGTLSMNQQKIPVNIKTLGLRGTTLKNTDHALGIVIYTGHSTKIMKNAKNPPSKMSGVLKKMNQILYSIFILQGFIIITFASASVNWQDKNAENHYYLKLDTNVNLGTFIVRVFTYLVAYSHLIPISLYVALEILKLLEGYLIKNDTDMYYAELDKPANVRSSDLVEELGQVEFIFSDKTGTLTRNEMEFKKCSINFEIYGNCTDESLSKNKFTINGDTSAYELLMDAGENKHKRYIKDFFVLLAVCHTVMPEIDKKTGELKYQASSPDELALVLGAAKMGFTFKQRTSSNVEIELPTGERQVWEVLCEFPFDSTRKRMSLIVRKPTGEYYLMTKGADSIMMPRISIEKGAVQIIQKHLDQFAIDGLRTLVVGQKLLPESTVNEFMRDFDAAKLSSGPEKEKRLNELYDSMEMQLEMVGCTAIEDKLQEGVPECIATLLDADIRVWVLTGDKQETAIEIGKSCKLIMPGMDIVILSSKNQEEFHEKLDRHVLHYLVNLTDPIPPLEELSKQLVHKICIVIDGSTLAYALQGTKETRDKFFRLALLANSVICCRVSPKQKADVVHLAKSNGPWKTLSIGDGANDVSMIMEAHIGVGIYGKEGAQAVRSADFALGQFAYLKKLLLYHGRLNYRRISNFILYYFYKNVIVVFTEIYFAFYNGFSGQIYFAEWLPMLYNSLWTSWPCMSNYLLDRDVPKEVAYKYPKLYKAGHKHYYFNMATFWGWMLSAAWHGIICFFLPVFGLSGVNDTSGQVRGHWWISTVSFCLIMHIITMKLFIQTTLWNKLNITVSVISIVFYYFCLILLSVNGLAKMVQPQLNGVFFNVLGSLRGWIVLLFIPWVAIGPDIIFIVFKKIIKPSPCDKVLRITLNSKRALPVMVGRRN